MWLPLMVSVVPAAVMLLIWRSAQAPVAAMLPRTTDRRA
jgi:hypothetical protein